LNLIASLSDQGTPLDIPILSKKEVYVVVGCGPVGLLTIAASKALLLWRGISLDDICIFAIDTIPDRLGLAEKWGAIPLLLLDLSAPNTETSSPTNLQEETNTPIRDKEHSLIPRSIVDISQYINLVSIARGRSGRGADAVMECVGASSALSLAYSLLAPAGILSSIGVHSTSFPFSPSDAYDKNITYRSGRCPARSLMPAAEFMLRWYRDYAGVSVEQMHQQSSVMQITTDSEGDTIGDNNTTSTLSVVESTVVEGEGEGERRGVLRPTSRHNSVGRRLNLTDIITHRMKLSEVERAYRVFDRKEEGCMKVVLYPDV
jgi:threonine dehydrogenase-like Zn-dependent dehydrogenase